MKVSYWDVEELAYRAMGIDESDIDGLLENGDIDQAVFDKYKISFEIYEQIINDLIPFTITNESPITGQKFKGFVDAKQQRFIVKVKVDE